MTRACALDPETECVAFTTEETVRAFCAVNASGSAKALRGNLVVVLGGTVLVLELR